MKSCLRIFGFALLFLVGSSEVFTCFGQEPLQIFWRNEASSGNWLETGDPCAEIGTANSQWWYPHFGGNAARNAPNCSGTYNLVFDNNHQTTMNNNIGFVQVNRITFTGGATNARTINGLGIDLRAPSLNAPRINNLTAASHTFNTEIALQNNPVELNPISGNLTFTNNIFTNGHFIDVYGNNNQNLNISGVISGTGGLTIRENSNVNISGVQTYSGNTSIIDGDLIVLPGGNLNPVTNVTISTPGIFNLNNQNVTVNSVSETGSFNGGVIALGGGTLTIDGNYVGTRNQNSISGTGNLVKNGAGVLSLYGAQTYTGTTTVSGGTLIITGNMASSNIIVQSGATLQINGASVINNLTIESGGTVVQNNFSLTVNGNLTSAGSYSFFTGAINPLTLNGNLSITAGTFTLSNTNNGNMILLGNFTKTGGIFNCNGRQVRFQGSTDQTFLSNVPENINQLVNAKTFGTLNLNSNINIPLSGNTAVFNANTATIIPSGVIFEIGNTTATVIANNAGSTITVNGTLRNAGVVNGSAATLIFSGTGLYEHNWTIAAGAIPLSNWQVGSTCAIIGYTSSNSKPGNLTQSFHHFIWNTPGVLSAASANLIGELATVNGNFSVLSTGGSALRLTGSAGLNLTIGGNLIVQNGLLELTNNTSIAIVNIEGNLSVNGGSLFLANGSSGTGIINLKGNLLIASGTTLTETSSSTNHLLNFTGTSSQNINIAGAFTNQINLRFDNPAGYVLQTNLPVNASSFLSMRRGVFSGAGSIIYNATGTTLIYDGAVALTTTDKEFPATAGPVRLTLATTPVADITLHASRTLPAVSGVLTLTSGRLILGNSHLTTLWPNAAAISGGSVNSYIRQTGTGRIIRSIPTTANSLCLLPIGTATGYTPFEILFTSNLLLRTVTVEMFDTFHPQFDDPNTPPDYLNRYFQPNINPSTGPYSYRINKMGYLLPGDVVGTASNINISLRGLTDWTDIATTPGNPLVSGTTLNNVNNPLNSTDFSGRNSNATYTWNGSTNSNWTEPLNWTPYGVPSPNDNISITAPGTYELIISDIKEIKNVGLTGSGVLNLSETATLRISGTFTYTSSATASFNCSSSVEFTSGLLTTVPPLNYGNLNLTGGSRSFVNNATIGICGNLVAVPMTAANVMGSTVNFNGTTNQSISGGGTRFDNLIISNTGGTVNTLANINLENSMTIISNARLDLGTTLFTITNATTSVVDGFLRSAGAVTGASTTNLTFSSGGTYEHNYTTTSGTIPTANWDINSSCEIIGYTANLSSTVGGGWGQAFGNFTWNCANQGSSTFNLFGRLTTVNGNFRIITTGTGSLIYTTSGAPVLTIGKDFTIEDGTFNINNTSATPIIRVGGNFSTGSGQLTRTSGPDLSTIEFNGSTVQTITIPATTQISNNISFRVNNPLGISLATTLPINNNATFFRTLGNITGLGVITYPGATTTLVYDGSTSLSSNDKDWPATSGPTKVIINNTAPLAGTGITLHASRDLPSNGTLTLTAGKLTLGNNTLTLLNTATTTALTGGSTTAFVATSGTGQLIRALATGDNTYLYPVGNGVDYTPASFAFSANSVNNRQLGLRVLDTTHPDMAPNPTVYLQNVHWVSTLNNTAGTYSYTPAFTFINPAQVIGTDPATDLGLARWDGVVWSNVSVAPTIPPTLTSPMLDQGNGVLNGTGWTGRKQTPPTIYTWSFPGDGTWTMASNWTPNGVPTTGDEVQFTHAGNYKVTNVPVGITLRKMNFIGGGTTNLLVNGAGTVKFKGGVNPVFDVASGTTAIVSGNNASNWIIESGGTGNVNGSVGLRGFSSSTAHTLQAEDAGALRFKTGSYFATGVLNTTNFSGNPFGDSGIGGTVIFEDGSVYAHFDGANPFGLGQPQSKVIFETGSLYRYSDNNPSTFALPSLTGRTYANFEYNSNQSKINSLGSSSYTMDDLTVSQGNYAININVNSTIRGNITVAAGSKLEFSPEGINRVITLNGTVQNINTVGTGVLEVNGDGNGFTVVSGTTVNMIGESTVEGTGRFTLASGATLGIESALGIAVAGLNEGNIQTTTRSYSTSANYVYQLAGDQITGLGLPSGIVVPGSLTIASTGNVTHSRPSTTTTPILNLNSGFFDNTGKTVVISAGGAINAVAGNFTTGVGGGTVNIGTPGNVVINATSNLNFYNVTLLNGNGSLDFGNTGTPTVHNNLTINNGRWIANNAPLYASGSTLIYNTGFTYGRGREWQTPSGRGFPHHVTLSGSTTLQPGANSNQSTPMNIGGDLTIQNGSNLFLDIGGLETSQNLVVPGNFTMIGSAKFSLSTWNGNLILGGNWNRSNNADSEFNPRGRQVVFNGPLDQMISRTGSATETFNYLVNAKPAGDLILDNSNVIVNGEAGNILILFNTSKLNLNGRKLFVSGSPDTNLELIDGTVEIIGGPSSILNFSNGNKNVVSFNSGSLVTGSDVIVNLESGLDCGGDLFIVKGVFQLNPGGSVFNNPPLYDEGSTLRYATGGTHGRGTEWSTTAGAGFPHHVEVTQYQVGNPTTLNLHNGNSTTRRIAGDLTVITNGTLDMDDMTDPLEVEGNVNVSSFGTLILSSAVTTQGGIKIAGNLTRTIGILISNQQEVEMNGNSPQIITGFAELDKLAINNGGSEVTTNQILVINERLRLTNGLFNLSFPTFMAQGSEVRRTAASGIISASPSVQGSNQYDMRYTSESFATGVEFSPSATAVRDLIIEGNITTTLSDARTFNRNMVLIDSNFDLDGKVLTARGRGDTTSFSGSITVRGTGTRTITGQPGSRFDITGLEETSPLNYTKTVSTFDGANLVFAENVLVRIGGGAVDFGFSGFNPTTINGTLEVLLGGSVGLILNSCFYGDGSTLRFANGLDYGVINADKTWAQGSITSELPGIPYNVVADSTGTDLQLFATRAVRNNMTISNGATLELMSSFDGNFNIGGSWSNHNESGFIQGTSSVVFDGSLAQSITCPGGEVFHNLTFQNEGSKTIFDHLEVKNDLTIAVGSGVFDSNDRFISLGRNWVNAAGSAAFDESNSTVTFNGLTDQIISNPAGEDFHDVVMSKSTGNLRLQCDISLDGDMTFNNGIIRTQGQQVIFESGANNIGAGPDSYISGQVRKEGLPNGLPWIFPVGDYNDLVNPGVDVFQPAGLVATAANNAAFTVSYSHQNYLPGNFDPPIFFPLNNVSTCNFWNIDHIGSTPSARVRLYWDEATGCYDIGDPNELTVAHYNSTNSRWEDAGVFTYVSAIPYTTGYVESAPVTSFSPFTIGSGGPGNVLPISLLSFDATLIENQVVKTDWSTATETNNDYFSVEKSVDAQHWDVAGTVAGAGNSTSIQHYQFADDAPYPGLSYYRLRQTDFDGTYSFSQVVPVQRASDGSLNLINLYRTAEGVQLVFESKAPYLVVELFDMLGQRVYADLMENEDGQGFIQPTGLSRGMYILRLSHGLDFVTGKVVY